MIDILMRRRQNNPILVGEAGVGKTAVVEAFALAIATGSVPDKLRGVALHALDLNQLQAGAGVKGEFERRLKGVVDQVKALRDARHAVRGRGAYAHRRGAGRPGQGDAANIPQAGIGAWRPADHRRDHLVGVQEAYREGPPPLTRRFPGGEGGPSPSIEGAIRMIRAPSPRPSPAINGISIRDGAIRVAVELSARYLPERQLPDKGGQP